MLALGAAELDPPVDCVGGGPVDRMDEPGSALRTDMQVLDQARGVAVGPGRSIGPAPHRQGGRPCERLSRRSGRLSTRLAAAPCIDSRRDGAQRPHDPGRDRRRPDRLDPYDPSLIQPSSVDVRVDRSFRCLPQRPPPLYRRAEGPGGPGPSSSRRSGTSCSSSIPASSRWPDPRARPPPRRHRRPPRGQSSLGRLGLLIHSDRRLRRRRLRGQPHPRALERRQPPDHALPRHADRPDLLHAHGRPRRARLRLSTSRFQVPGPGGSRTRAATT